MDITAKPSALRNEFARLERQERDFLRGRARRSDGYINRLLADKVPDKLQDTLRLAFAKAFSLVFRKGSGLIEKTTDKKRRSSAYRESEAVCGRCPDRWALRSFSSASRKAGLGNVLISGAAGVGMGVLGVGIPDIPVFTAMLLKNIYEIAQSYGCPYEGGEEQIFILMLIRTALENGEAAAECDGTVNAYIQSGAWPQELTMDSAEREAADTLSRELLYLKFLQGIPVAGAIGGAYDAVYMHRVSTYADLKYRRRFLMGREKYAESLRRAEPP